MISSARRLATITAIAAAALLIGGSAVAQQKDSTVAKLRDAEGNVLVSQGDAMIAGANDQRLAVGTRVVTTSGAKVTISYDVGCDVRLKENERFTVTVGPCAVLLGQVESLGPAAGAIGGGTTGTTTAMTATTAGGGAAGTGGAAAAGGTTLGTFAAAGGGVALITTGVITGVGIYELTRKNPVSPN